MPHAIFLNGYPGSGKSTLLRKLAKDLAIPGIGKDVLKEALSDGLDASDEVWSALIGATAARSLNILFEEAMAKQKPLIIENAFIAQFAKPELTEIIQRLHVQCLEIYCVTDSTVRKQRMAQRRQEGRRHAVHTVAEDARIYTEDELALRYPPLHIGEVITVDTTNFGEIEYHKLLERIRQSKTYGGMKI